MSTKLWIAFRLAFIPLALAHGFSRSPYDKNHRSFLRFTYKSLNPLSVDSVDRPTHDEHTDEHCGCDCCRLDHP